MSDSVRPHNTAAHQAPPFLGLFRQGHWSGLQFPSPVHESESESESEVVSDLCDSMDYSLPGSSVHGISQARVLEWGAIAFSLHAVNDWNSAYLPITGCSVTRLYLTLCDPMDYSSPDSSVHGISQVRILEWIAVSSSSGSSQPRDRTQVSCIAGVFFTTEPSGKPCVTG